MARTFEETLPKIAYGPFPRRLRAYLIDCIIIMCLLVVALLVASLARADSFTRVIGFSFVGVWLLYEPILVSLAGSTVGHYLTNLRVVDDRSYGNVSFLKAIARHLIKTVLGLYSFITMGTTLRHKAVHDLMTRSTVQVRDRSRATSSDYVAERIELLSPIMPSRIRRIAIILCYIFLVFLLLGSIDAALISRKCALLERCSYPERVSRAIIEFLGLGMIAFVIIQGWRGWLYGCRRQTLELSEPSV